MSDILIGIVFFGTILVVLGVVGAGLTIIRNRRMQNSEDSSDDTTETS